MASSNTALHHRDDTTEESSPATAGSRKLLVLIATAVYASSCVGLATSYTKRMLLGITSDNGENHLVQAEPSYEEAGRLAGYFESNGHYRGGTARWNDWSEGEFICEIASSNGAFCQHWSTLRHNGKEDDQYISGTCTCSSPSADQTAETQEFCTAWSCAETRHQESCDGCERSYYTMCECDGIDEDSESAFCQDWTCPQGPDVTSLGEGDTATMASVSSTETREGHDNQASSASKNTQNSAVVAPSSLEVAEQEFELYYTCSQVSDAMSPWCIHWKGMTKKFVGPVIEELCECAGTNDSGYCTSWSCTTYHMRECDVCWVNRGGFLGVLVMAVYAPLAALSAMGPKTYRCIARATAPWALAAACTMAAYIGGVEAVLQRVLPGTFFVWIGTRWLSTTARSGRIQPYLGPFLWGQLEQLDHYLKSQHAAMGEGSGVTCGTSPDPPSVRESINSGFSPSRGTQHHQHQQHEDHIQIYRGSTAPSGGPQPHPSSTGRFGDSHPLMMTQMQERQQVSQRGSPWNAHSNTNIASFGGGGVSGVSVSPSEGGLFYTNASNSLTPGLGFNAGQAGAHHDYDTTPVFRTGVHGGTDCR